MVLFVQPQCENRATPSARNSLVTRARWTLIGDKEQYIKFFAMTVTSHALANQNAVFPSAKKNT